MMLAILALAWGVGIAAAQTPSADSGKAAPKNSAPAPAAPVKDARPAAPGADDPAETGSKGEIYVDPNAKKTLAIFSPISFTGPAIRVGNPPDDRSRVQNMAARNENEDAAFLKRYVEYFASELSNKNNLNALINPGPNPLPNAPAARKLEQAVDALTKPLIDSRALGNTSFLTNYSRVLFESSLPKLLENNYMARMDAMIVLGMAGYPAPAGLQLYIDQIKKPDQVMVVKVWAARGIANAAQQGRVNLDASKTLQSAEALIGWLQTDPKPPWFAQVRALEALGSIRFATNAPRGKIDAASVVLRHLADPASRPEVRAQAAWAVGMMRFPTDVTPFNFALLGHEFGKLTVELGDRIVEQYDDNAAAFEKDKDQAAILTGLLLFQMVPGLTGAEGVSESGLLRSAHPSLAAGRPFLVKIEAKVKAVTLEAYELIRAGGNNQKARRDDLDAKLADLKSFLTQSPPRDRKLVPGGPEIPAGAPQVAGAARR